VGREVTEGIPGEVSGEFFDVFLDSKGLSHIGSYGERREVGKAVKRESQSGRMFSA